MLPFPDDPNPSRLPPSPPPPIAFGSFGAARDEKKTEGITIAKHKGYPSVVFDDSEISALSRPFKLTLIGKFRFGRPNLAAIRGSLERIGFTKLHIGLLDRERILIRCADAEEYYRLWIRARWNIQGFTMIIQKWSPEFGDRDSPIVPLWIGLEGLPVHLFQARALMAIASVVGNPIKLDAATRALSRPSVARVCVELNLSTPPPTQVWIQNGREGFFQKIYYEDMPLFCPRCLQLGHNCLQADPMPAEVEKWMPKQKKTATESGNHGQGSVPDADCGITGQMPETDVPPAANGEPGEPALTEDRIAATPADNPHLDTPLQVHSCDMEHTGAADLSTELLAASAVNSDELIRISPSSGTPCHSSPTGIPVSQQTTAIPTKDEEDSPLPQDEDLAYPEPDLDREQLLEDRFLSTGGSKGKSSEREANLSLAKSKQTDSDGFTLVRGRKARGNRHITPSSMTTRSRSKAPCTDDARVAEDSLPADNVHDGATSLTPSSANKRSAGAVTPPSPIAYNTKFRIGISGRTVEDTTRLASARLPIVGLPKNLYNWIDQADSKVFYQYLAGKISVDEFLETRERMITKIELEYERDPGQDFSIIPWQ